MIVILGVNCPFSAFTRNIGAVVPDVKEASAVMAVTTVTDERGGCR